MGGEVGGAGTRCGGGGSWLVMVVLVVLGGWEAVREREGEKVSGLGRR